MLSVPSESFRLQIGLIIDVPDITIPTPNSFGLEIQRFLRANASTLLATAIEWGLVTVLVKSGGNYLWAAGIGACLGAMMDFMLKRKWAFMRRGHDSLGAESARYVLVSAMSLGWNLLISYALVHLMHVSPIPGVIAASVMVGALWNYPLHRLFVFPDVASGGLLQRAS